MLARYSKARVLNWYLVEYLNRLEEKICINGPQIHMHKKLYHFYFYLVPLKLCTENTSPTLLGLSVDISLTLHGFGRGLSIYVFFLPHSVCTPGQGSSCSHYPHVKGEDCKFPRASAPGAGPPSVPNRGSE